MLWPIVHDETFDYGAISGRWWAKRFAPYLAGLPIVYTQCAPDQRKYAEDELQLLPNELKPIVLPGHYEYDLSTAMPSLVLQAAWRADEGNYPHLLDYVNNKRAWRRIVAEKFGRHEKTALADAKQLLQDTFSLAKLIPHPNVPLFQQLGCSRRRFEAFKHDRMISGLRADAERAWKAICGDDWADGTARFRAYERLERQVMDVVEQELARDSTRTRPYPQRGVAQPGDAHGGRLHRRIYPGLTSGTISRAICAFAQR